MWISWVAKHDEYFIFYIFIFLGMLQGMEKSNQNCPSQSDYVAGFHG